MQVFKGLILFIILLTIENTFFLQKHASLKNKSQLGRLNLIFKFFKFFNWLIARETPFRRFPLKRPKSSAQAVKIRFWNSHHFFARVTALYNNEISFIEIGPTESLRTGNKSWFSNVRYVVYRLRKTIRVFLESWRYRKYSWILLTVLRYRRSL